jgi:hypothetical protein
VFDLEEMQQGFFTIAIKGHRRVAGSKQVATDMYVHNKRSSPEHTRLIYTKCPLGVVGIEFSIGDIDSFGKACKEALR